MIWWQLLQRRFQSWTGIRLAPSAVSLAEGVVHERATLHGRDAEDYLDDLDLPAWEDERSFLVDQLIVRTTWFMREESGLLSLVEALERKAADRKRPEVRVWCAGCSTGQEPYSLAIALLERGLQPRIVATDISDLALRRAREARYPEQSIRGLPPEWRERYLGTLGGDYVVRSEVRECVTFSRHNLARRPHVPKLDDVDAVVCRNVLIYFDRDQAVGIVEAFARAAPRGYILLGAVEQPLVWLAPHLAPHPEFGGTLLVAVPAHRTPDVHVIAAPPPPIRTPGRRTPRPGWRSAERVSSVESGRRRSTQRKIAAAARSSSSPVVQAPAPSSARPSRRESVAVAERPVRTPREAIAEADALRRAGDVSEALALLERHIEQQPLTSEVHVSRGLVLKQLGQLREAVQSFRNARFLSSDGGWMAPWQLGLCLELLGDHPAAREAYRHALSILDAGGPSGMPSDRKAEAMATTVAASCRARLDALR